MERINLNLVSHISPLVESARRTHSSERKEAESKKEREHDDKYFNLDGICLAAPSLTHKPNHLCFTAGEVGIRAGLNGVCKISFAFVVSSSE